MVMIPMDCPRCGRKGSVPTNLVNRSLNCKSCNAPFYVTQGGDVMLGEPPVTPEERERRKAEEKKRDRKKKESDFDFSFDLRSTWNRMEPAQRNRTLLLALCALVVLGGAAYMIAMPRIDPVIDRAVYVAKAVVDSDSMRIKAASLPETAEDAGLWLEKARITSHISGTSRDFDVRADIYDGGGKTGSATVMATLIPLSGTEMTGTAIQDPRATKVSIGSTRSTPAQDSFTSFMMTLVKDTNGQWRLDGRSSLQLLPKDSPNQSKRK